MRTLYTDYPITKLGDEPGKEAPIREVQLLWYDGDKYCDVMVDEVITTIKWYYLYNRPCRPYDVILDYDELRKYMDIVERDILSHSAVCRFQRRLKQERYRFDKEVQKFRKEINKAIDKVLGPNYTGVRAHF